MTGILTDEEKAQLLPAETAAFPSPIPTQIVSSDEYFPEPQTPKQREVEERIKTLGDDMARKLGVSRRKFFTTSAGMAASFMVMNQVYGNMFDVSAAEVTDPAAANARSA